VRQFARASARIGLAGAAALALAAAATGQDAPRARTWAELGELPDFTTGIWEVSFGGPRAGGGPPAQAELTPEYAAKAAAYRAQGLEDTPAANCVPAGMPGIMGQPYPMQFFFGPREVTIQLEAYEQVRHIYTDGRPHPDNPDPTFNGDSIGHWEGDTLVVDTVGFVPFTPLSGNVWEVGHSERMHIVERMRLLDENTLEIETTIDDPAALVRPWTSTRTFARHPDWTIAEYVCEENNRNSLMADGQAGIDVTPPEAAEQGADAP